MIDALEIITSIGCGILIAVLFSVSFGKLMAKLIEICEGLPKTINFFVILLVLITFIHVMVAINQISSAVGRVVYRVNKAAEQDYANRN